MFATQLDEIGVLEHNDLCEEHLSNVSSQMNTREMTMPVRDAGVLRYFPMTSKSNPNLRTEDVATLINEFHRPSRDFNICSSLVSTLVEILRCSPP